MSTADLAAALADRAAHEAARQAARAWLDDWQSGEATAAMIALIDRALAAEAAAERQQLLAAAIADIGWLADWATGYAALLARHRFVEPPLPTVAAAGGPGTTLIERRRGSGRARVRLRLDTGADIGERGATAAPACLLPGASALRVLAGQCRVTGIEGPARRMGPQDPPLTVASGGRPWTLEPVEGPLLLIEAQIAGPGATRHARPDGSEDSGTWQGLARDRRAALLPALRTLDPARTGPAARPLLADAEAGVRWMALREWLAADPAAAVPTLLAFADDDPDAQLRAMAAAVRDRLLARDAA